jgi:hypothetical protein
VILNWVPWEKKYDPRWTESVGGPGRWQTFCGDPEAPSMPAFPAFTLARAGERSVYAVHNDPKSKRLDYLGHPKDAACPQAIPVADKEEIVALAVQADGTIHALTFIERNLFYLTNKGEPTREVLETGDLTEIRGAVAADETGAAHAAYRDARSGGLLYRTNLSGKWTSAVVEPGAGVGLACAIAVDARGKEHGCYTVGAGVRYATNATGSWEVFAVASGKPLPGCDIAIDEQGYAHMCYAIDGKMAYATNRPEEKKKEEKR